MKRMKTGLTCPICNSPIISYKKGEEIIYECSYCGYPLTDYYFYDNIDELILEVDKNEKENL